MPSCNRRTFLTLSGTVLGGIATGQTVTAAERTDRYVVETRGTLRGVDVIHDMPGVDMAVVRASERQLRDSRAVVDYAPDIEIRLDTPAVNDDTPVIEDSTVADEPYYSLQWDKQALNVPTAHETTTGEGTRVAIIDSGVAAGHPDLTVNESLSRNFTGDGLGKANPAGGYHGTHVGGIVGASDNGTGVIGTAPGTELIDCRVFSVEEGASFGTILAAIVYSANVGADVANLSLGAYPVPREGQGSFYGKRLNTVMTYANAQGTLLTISAGNDAADLQHDGRVCTDFDGDDETECHPVISLPNEGAQALSVAATGPIGFGWDPSTVGDTGEPSYAPAIYTNYGTNNIDLGAPGGNYSLAGYAEYYDDDDGDGEPDEDTPAWYLDMVINAIAVPTYETDEEGTVIGLEDVDYTYSWVSGTSMAAPNVAGAAALVKSANPDYNPNQVEAALKRAASVPAGYDKSYYGAGFLNVVDAL